MAVREPSPGVPSRRARSEEAESAEEAREERRARSLEEPLDVLLRRRTPYPTLEVRNPVHRTRYRVLLPEFPEGSVALCTCTDFARRGLGTCKHVEAGVRWLSTHPGTEPASTTDPPPPRTDDLWSEIDRRERLRPPPATVRGRELARVGAALFDRS